MGNLLDPLTGIIHADVNEDHGWPDGTPANPFRRTLCDLSTAVPDRWRDVQGDKVTCESCQFRIDYRVAEAYGDLDPTGKLTNAAVRVAEILYKNRDGDLADDIAVALYPNDYERQELFLERAIGGEVS